MDRNDLQLRMALAAFTARFVTALAASGTIGLGAACVEAGLDFERLGPILPELAAIADEAGRQQKPQESDHPRWMYGLLKDVTGDLPEDAGMLEHRLDRLHDCIMAIPSYDDYAALMERYAGSSPDGPRPGRQDDVPSGTPDDKTDRTCRALKFLKYPARLEYIMSGTTDLDACMPLDVVAYLHYVQVHVKDDLGRINDNVVLSLPGVTPRIVAKIYAVRSGKPD